MEKEAAYLCKRRATLELETILWSFFLTEWDGLDEQSRRDFISILKREDRELENFLFKSHPPPCELNSQIIEKLKSHRIK